MGTCLWSLRCIRTVRADYGFGPRSKFWFGGNFATPQIDTDHFHKFPKSIAQILGKTRDAEVRKGQTRALKLRQQGEITVPEVMCFVLLRPAWSPRSGPA